MVEWILKVNYHIRFLLHYLNDFLTVGPSNSWGCTNNVAITRSQFLWLSLPLHPSKCKGPTTILVFLGVELNSITKFVAIVELLPAMGA